MKPLTVLLLILAPFISFSQKTDYLVKHNGDTLYGKIELRKKIFVLTSAGGTVSEIAALDVNKVYSENFRFHTVVPCKLHVYVDNLTELELYSYTNMDRDTVMVLDEVYSTPKMNLYWGLDNFKRQYYFYKMPSDSLPVQLYINYSLAGGETVKGNLTTIGYYIGGATHIEVQKGYINQLRLIMGDCKKISEGEWELLDYRIYSFKSVIKKYNKCK